jgi:hypothetical protein
MSLKKWFNEKWVDIGYLYQEILWWYDRPIKF